MNDKQTRKEEENVAELHTLISMMLVKMVTLPIIQPEKHLLYLLIENNNTNNKVIIHII